MALPLARTWAQLNALLVPSTPAEPCVPRSATTCLANQVLGMLWRWVLLAGALAGVVSITSAVGWVLS